MLLKKKNNWINRVESECHVIFHGNAGQWRWLLALQTGFSSFWRKKDNAGSDLATRRQGTTARPVMVLIKITAKWWFNSFKSTEFGCFLQRNSSARFESGAEATVAFVFSEQFFRLMWHRLMCFDFFLFQTWNYTLFIHLRLSSTSSNGTHECVNCSSWISWLIGVIGRNWAQLGAIGSRKAGQ